MLQNGKLKSFACKDRFEISKQMISELKVWAAATRNRDKNNSVFRYVY